MEEIPQTTLRETLETNIAASEAGTLPTVEEAARQPRDEIGRFAEKQKEEAEVAKASQAKPEVEKPWDGPSSWKKEYRPLYDKLNQGSALTAQEAKQLAEYQKQREGEFATGVSTYKAEAENAKGLQAAIAPFVPELQRRNLDVGNWIRAVGTAHYTLINGTPDQKLQLIRDLARGAGVPIEMVASQASGQNIAGALMQQIHQLRNQQLAQEHRWQQQQVGQLQSEVQKFSEGKEHFEALRETMARLLESGLAHDLNSAHEQATYLVPEVRAKVLQAPQALPNPAQIAAQARAKALSPKSSTPSGSGNAKPQGLRAQLSETFDVVAGGRV